MKMVFFLDDSKESNLYRPTIEKVMQVWNVNHEILGPSDLDNEEIPLTAPTTYPTTYVLSDNGEPLYALLGNRQMTEIIDVVKEYMNG